MSSIKQRMNDYLVSIKAEDEREVLKLMNLYIGYSPNEMAGPNATLTRDTIMKTKGRINFSSALIQQLKNDSNES